MDLGAMQEVRKNSPVTTTWVAGNGVGSENPIDIRGANQLVLFIHFNKGSITSYELRVEVRLEGHPDYREMAATVGADGVSTLRAMRYSVLPADFPPESFSELKFYLPIPVMGHFALVHVWGTGTVTGSQCAVYAAVGRT